MKSWSRRFPAVGLVLLLAAAVAWAAVTLTGDGQDTSLVTRVIDGDTIELENGQVVRYLLIDTPETVHPEKPVECFGPEATERNRQLVEGRRVRLEKDVTDRDAYGRLLRYVYIDEAMVQGELIREGYGYVYSRQPDVKYLRDIAALEREAREQGAGLWMACEASPEAP